MVSPLFVLRDALEDLRDTSEPSPGELQAWQGYGRGKGHRRVTSEHGAIGDRKPVVKKRSDSGLGELLRDAGGNEAEMEDDEIAYGEIEDVCVEDAAFEDAEFEDAKDSEREELGRRETCGRARHLGRNFHYR